MKKAGILTLFLLLIAGLAALAQGAPKARTVVHDFEADKTQATPSPEIEYAPAVGFRLTRDKSANYMKLGVLTSAPEAAEFPFNDVVLSWNLDLPEGTGALIEVRALGEADAATPWFEMARLGTTPLPDQRLKRDAAGRISQDTLLLASFWQKAQYRVTLYTNMPHHTPTLRLMAICYADTVNRVPYVAAPIPTERQPWMRSLPVPWRSQMVEDPSISSRICGPTSTSMALAYHGCNLPTADFSADAWDDYSRIFGNWPFIAQGTAKHGFKAWVTRCEDFKPLEEEIAAGRPGVIAIQFANKELDNAPFAATGGHLILCVGFTRNGDLICNDPGTRRKIFDHVVYKRSQIAKAWLSHSGVLIRVIPRKK